MYHGRDARFPDRCPEAPIPVLGHVFVGLATAVATRPPVPKEPARRLETVVRGLWGFIAVILAYAPDICTQALHAAGWTSAHLFGHSILFAGAASALAALALRGAGVPARRFFIVALLSIAGHDLLDIVQATDKAPLWPFSSRTISTSPFEIPSGLAAETILFGGLFLVFLLARGVLRRLLRPPGRSADPSPLARRLRAVNIVLVASIAVLAIATQSLRDLRERQLESSRVLIEGGRYADGLGILAESERWPSSAKPGRADYLRGIASLGSGNRDKAESYLLRSYHADPAYPWVVIDLALFYAESPRPLADRRNLAAPYLDALRRDFGERKEAAEAARRADEISRTLRPGLASLPFAPGRDPWPPRD